MTGMVPHPQRRSADHPVVRAVFGAYVDFLVTLVPDPERCSVLDVGCGNGFLTARLRERFARVVAVDVSPEMLRMFPGHDRVQASADRLPFRDRCFDLVVESQMLHHLVPADRMPVIREMSRVARRGIACFEPNALNPLVRLWSCFHAAEAGARVFTRSYLQNLIRSVPLRSPRVMTGSLLVPNLAPEWLIPWAKMLERTPLRRLGFDLFCGGTF